MAVEGVEGGKKEEEKMDEEDAETEKAPVEEKKPEEPGLALDEDKEKDVIPPVVIKGRGDIVINPKENISKESKSLLAQKRGRKGKRVPIQLGPKKEKKVHNPTKFQEILNKVEKLPLITPDIVKQTANDMNYKLDDRSIKFFTDLGLARVSIKKFGLPSHICKEPFHFFCTSDFYKSYLRGGLKVLTDDKLVLQAYLAFNFSSDLKKYQPYCEYCNLERYSFVSDNIVKITNIGSGYVQDFNPNMAIIINDPLTDAGIATVKTAINNRDVGTMALLEYGLLNGEKINFFKNELGIFAGKETLDNLLQASKKISVVNSKNKLKDGLKYIKTNGDIATYVNIIDIKPTDFAPAVLMVHPQLTYFTMFFESTLDLNQVFKVVAEKLVKKEVKGIEYLNFPPNSIFWDNVGSYAQLLGLINLIYRPALSSQITELIDIYNGYRDVFKGWKTVYKLFESIITGFYDTVTTKLSIDGITRLDTKTADFISHYNYLKRNETFEKLRKFLSMVPNGTCMNNFALTNMPLEVAYALRRLIAILRLGKTDNEMTEIVEMFRTIGIYCTRVFFGGQYEMIPKIRSPAAFLGGVAGDMDNETLRENIDYLLKSYKRSDEGKEEDGPVIEYDEMDNLVDVALDNSNRHINDKFLNSNFHRIKEKIKADGALMSSLRTEITELLRDGVTKDEIKANYHFLDNPIFSNYIIAFKKIEKVFRKKKKTGKVNAREIADVIKIDPKMAEKLRKKRILKKTLGKKKIKELKEKGEEKKNIEDLKPESVVVIDKDAVIDAVGEDGGEGAVKEVVDEAKEVLAKKEE